MARMGLFISRNASRNQANDKIWGMVQTAIAALMRDSLALLDRIWVLAWVVQG